MNCIHCQRQATEMHHVIKRDKRKKAWGTDHPDNLAPLCRDCHNAIHHGRDTELRKAVLKTCYDYIRPNIDNCWNAKIKPKIVRLIEQGEL